MISGNGPPLQITTSGFLDDLVAILALGPVAFVLLKPGTEIEFCHNGTKGGALIHALNCWALVGRLPSLSIHNSQSLSLCVRLPHQ